jgi:23S rRNA (guanosine2251-2'-O)-methyltransferase
LAKNSIYLYGKNSVLERVRCNPSSIKGVYLQDNFKAQEVVNAIDAENIPIKQVSEKELIKIKRADRLQGIVAEVERFKYEELNVLLQQKQRPSLLFLDNLNDPHNLGSILRIAACFGGFAIVIPERNSCDVNETVLHVASGGENYLSVSRVTNLSRALTEAKKAGYWAAGAVVDGGRDVSEESLPFPLCLVLGSEGKGIRPGLMKHLDILVTVPMKGAKLSFNVAMSFAIFGHEITKQKKTNKQ